MSWTEEISPQRCAGATFGGIARGLLALAVAIAFARLMDVEAFGEFSAAQSMLAIATLPATMGMSKIAIRSYRSAKNSYDESHARGFRISGPLIILIASLITYVLLVGFHATMHAQTAINLVSFAAVLALLPLNALSAFLVASNAAHGAAVLASNISGWVNGLLLLGILALANVTFGRPLSILQAAGILAGATTITLLANTVLLRRIEPVRFRSGDRTYKVYDWVRTGASFASASLSLLILDRSGLIILGWVTANAQDAAHLSAAIRISSILLLIGLGLRPVFLPVLAEAAKKQDTETLRAVLRFWIVRSLAILLPISALAIWQGRLLLIGYGPRFEAAYPTLVIMVVSQVVAVSTMLFIPLCQFLDAGRAASLATSTSALLGVAAMTGFAFLWGDTGVALGMGLGLTLAGGSGLLITRKRIRQFDGEAAT
jgi:O-antigen/teichoic acid export membrane protein